MPARRTTASNRARDNLTGVVSAGEVAPRIDAGGILPQFGIGAADRFKNFSEIDSGNRAQRSKGVGREQGVRRLTLMFAADKVGKRGDEAFDKRMKRRFLVLKLFSEGRQEGRILRKGLAAQSLDDLP